MLTPPKIVRDSLMYEIQELYDKYRDLYGMSDLHFNLQSVDNSPNHTRVTVGFTPGYSNGGKESLERTMVLNTLGIEDRETARRLVSDIHVEFIKMLYKYCRSELIHNRKKNKDDII